MEIHLFLYAAIALGVLTIVWNSVMVYKETAVWRWYRADNLAKREQKRGQSMIVESLPERGGLSESERVLLRVEAYLASPMPCVNGQPEDATHRIVRVRDRSPDKVFGIDQNGKCFLLPDRD